MRRSFQSSQLPVFESEFVGRHNELETILMALETHSLVSIVGPSGIGKTRLAAKIAQAHTNRFQRGVVFVALANIHTREALVATLLSALHLHIAPSPSAGATSPLASATNQLADIFEQAIQFLATQEMLLILDGIDKLYNHLDLFYRLSQLDGPKVLLTARARLGLTLEFALDLHGLPYLDRLSPPANALPPAEHLFVQSVRQMNAGFEPTEDDMQHIRQICQMTEGMPLAIELAASWARLLPIRFIANQISQNLDWLTSPLAVSHNTQYSLRVVIDDFWRWLSAEEQHQLCRLSVFQDGFERDMAEALAGTSLFFLSALAQHAFVSRNTNGRYFLHQLLRQYAGEQLAKSPYDYQTRLRHAELMRGLSQQAKAAFSNPQRDAWLTRMQIELSNVREAMTWSLAQQQVQLALEMLVNLEYVWDGLDDVAEVCAWFESALQANLHEPVTTQSWHTQATQLFRRYSKRQRAK